MCRGVWALSDSAHGQPSQTSDFEFRLVKPNDGSNGYPISGRYQGWFFLKTLKGQVKVEDKEINIRFIAVVGEEGCHRVEGEGSNKFGKFKVFGTLSDNGFLQMYREYILRDPAILKRKPSVASLPSSNPPKSHVITTKESVNRVRKTSSLGTSYSSISDKLPVKEKPTAAIAPSTAASLADNSSRTQRLSQHMVKCADLLKELLKQPQSIWFAQPVDPIALKIPDYPTIVKEPMDFSTIQRNLDRHFYASPEAFSEHVRLVFRNAITYNTLRDNPVHIAARELSNRFEDRFRQLMSQLTAAGYGQTFAADILSKSGSTPRGSFGAPSKKGKNKPGLRRGNSFGSGQLPPPLATSDGGLQELHQKMLEMQNEISHLRAQVRKNEVKSEVELHVKDAANPLTLDEKKTLIAQIHRLPAAKMDEVVDIIRNATDVREEGDEVEISLDDLDTHTLRRLQSFVYDATAKRSYQPDIAYNNKKVKKEAKPRAAPAPKQRSQPLNLATASAPLSASVAPLYTPAPTRNENQPQEFTLFGDDNYDSLARQGNQSTSQ